MIIKILIVASLFYFLRMVFKNTQPNEQMHNSKQNDDSIEADFEVID